MNGQKPVGRKSNNFTFDFTSGYFLLDHLWPHHHFPRKFIPRFPLFPFWQQTDICTIVHLKNLIAEQWRRKFLTKIFVFIGRCAGCMHNIHNVHIAYCIICSSANIPAIPLQSNRKGINFTKPGDGGGNHSCCTHGKQYLINIQIENRRQITQRTWFATKMMMANDGG